MRDIKASGSASASGGDGAAAAGAAGKVARTQRIYRRGDGKPADDVAGALAPLGGAAGAPLPDGARAKLEATAGADLSAVRVHTDDASSTAAGQLGARAFATGNDIHFGAGQYQPDDPFGMHLLAHEVAHTVQQGGATAGPQLKLEVSEPGDAAEVAADRFADAVVHGGPAPALGPVAGGVVHRTPVAPTYGGSTGVRDLSKITIDAVPDFVAASFAGQTVRAHPHDPAIVHYTWMLYDPTDDMIGGFSTLPGNATSTTMPYELQPAAFTGPSFKPGKFILRCSGLNDKHHPIFYADRDFNVMSADQTTNTAAATGAGGTINFTRYDKTDGTVANPTYAVNAAISFLPDAGAGIVDAAFMQMIQTIDAQGNSQQNTVNADQDARKTPLAWSIDRVAGAPGPFYIEGNVTRRVGGRNVTTVADDPAWGQAGRSNGAGNASTPATLIDTPSWNHENFFKAESVVMCRSGADRGKIYGACTWGYSATSAGVVTLMPRSIHPTPSAEFTEAKTAWNDWQARQPAATAPTRAP